MMEAANSTTTPDEVQRRELRLKQSGMMDVRWRGTTPGLLGSNSVEISFETRCGAALRYRLDHDSAVHLYETLGQALGRQEQRDQSDRSSGMSREDGSPKVGVAFMLPPLVGTRRIARVGAGAARSGSPEQRARWRQPAVHMAGDAGSTVVY